MKNIFSLFKFVSYFIQLIKVMNSTQLCPEDRSFSFD